MKRMGHKMIDETDDQALSQPPYDAPVDARRFMSDDKHHWNEYDSVHPIPADPPEAAEVNLVSMDVTPDYPYTVEMTAREFEEYADWVHETKDERIGGWVELSDLSDDPVSHPSHYTTGSIEVKDYIADKNFNFFLGNVIKYVSRAGLKGDAVTDLLKARQYIDFELDRLTNED
jgi:hypothetical protein